MSITVLSSLVSNQIAAGEFINCPASILKELIENSLDAKSTRINVEVEDGGLYFISVHDNGCGISKYELGAAISRYSTNKITTMDDLKYLNSLGFRGEALASINSVSKLSISSCIDDRFEGWKIVPDKSNTKKNFILFPVSHPKGTTVIVKDLFYNIPIKKRFLKTKKTELIKIYDMFRRMALSSPKISFFLKSDGKLVKKYYSIDHYHDEITRLKIICSKSFSGELFPIQFEFNNMYITGWVGYSPKLKSYSVIQYFYVNHRVIEDRFLNHAFHKACIEIFGNKRLVSFVLYLQVPPDQIDVNIHPSKKEIRFFKFRLIHEFVYQAILNSLKYNKRNNLSLFETNSKYVLNCLATSMTDMSEHFNIININDKTVVHRFKDVNRLNINRSKKLKKKLQNDVYPEYYQGTFGTVLSVIKKCYLLLEKKSHNLLLISLPLTKKYLLKKIFSQIVEKKLQIYFFPTPIIIKTTSREQCLLLHYKSNFFLLGIEYSFDEQYVLFRTLPIVLYEGNIDVLFFDLLKFLILSDKVTTNNLIDWFIHHIINHIKYWDYFKAVTLLSEIEKYTPKLFEDTSLNLFQEINIESAFYNLNMYKFEKC